ncbi:hypothetical protein CPB84DRAFT_827385 [Gymnopilus junonius]|uniref:Uncharacterized protein n=1 Tax=Gymnopilus junonius TaxID=109634 RepID=A0A9P5N7V6_GYMJU|nr:hypothetical protein CPB84DRAFT_827385 [Gymnopilus junonius]
MVFGTTMRKALSPDPGVGEQRREPLSPSQTRTSQQQAVADDQNQPIFTDQPSQPSQPSQPLVQEDLSRSPTQTRPRMVFSATPQHIAERYEIMERELALDAERARNHGIAGYGSDAAAAAGASLQEVHQAPGRESTARDRESYARAPSQVPTGVAGPGSLARKEPPLMDSEWETVNNHETESPHVKHIERHIHHVQHHIQPIIITEDFPDESKDFANVGNESAMTGGDTMNVTETVYHHIYHVIQPVIEKESSTRRGVQTATPMHRVIHQVPVAERTQTHMPVPMQEFLRVVLVRPFLTVLLSQLGRRKRRKEICLSFRGSVFVLYFPGIRIDYLNI